MSFGAGKIVLTPGEPAGIGPELAVRIAQQAQPYELVAVADPELLSTTAERLKLPLSLNPFDASKPAVASEKQCLSILPCSLAAPTSPGSLNAENANYVLNTLQQASELCLAGHSSALVTGPVHKGVINEAGIPFTGHTEFFAQHCGVDHVVMMLATEGLRVALATTHLPLAEVPQAITQASLTQTLNILQQSLVEHFAIKQPKILVCGLNPHAGEGGHLGREEIDIIEPVLQILQQQGWNLVGPLPADTLFIPRSLKDADAVLAMYHDQGLPVLKHMGFGEAVNITLGLPFIRTSVDHGTALDLAGKGVADLGGLETALAYAASMASAQVEPINTP